eukprot:TRINITY_DN492_c0_g1_i1.p2 TRINITY_DN492_c0_g1~~TRINITY_DN492_c0_g1_i1.p2  ORF type:complete len:211 (-),score=50.27 TRINITY_DN492_c0_g1_i1:761-1372(-)
MADPVFLAASLGETIKLQKLLREGADANQKNPRGVTPLHAGASMGNTEIVTILIKEGKARVHIQDRQGRTSFHIAASQANIPMMEVMAEAGANIDSFDRSGTTPLMLVCESAGSGDGGYGASSGGGGDLFKSVQWLLGHGADINIKNNSGRTALMLAVKSGDARIVKELLSKGADPSRKDNLGMSSVDFAEGNAAIKALLGGR